MVQMLYGQPAWWHDLPADEHDLLHQLPPPHGALIAWLERELAEHGVRPWAVIREALEADEGLDADARALARIERIAAQWRRQLNVRVTRPPSSKCSADKQAKRTETLIIPPLPAGDYQLIMNGNWRVEGQQFKLGGGPLFFRVRER